MLHFLQLLFYLVSLNPNKCLSNQYLSTAIKMHLLRNFVLKDYYNFISFVTDWLEKYIGLINLIDGEANNMFWMI